MKLADGKRYLKLENVKTGDVITFKSEGEWSENKKFTYPDGKPKMDFVIKVDVKGEAFDMRINATNRKAMIGGFGDETASWVDKQAKVDIVKGLVSGQMKDLIMLTPLVDPNDIDFEE